MKRELYSPSTAQWPKVVLPEDETYGWKHPDELPYPEESDWPDDKIIPYLKDHAFSIPSKRACGRTMFQTVSADGITTDLPMKYRIPLLWVTIYQWRTLWLVLNSPEEKKWEEFKLRLLYLSMICTSLLESARYAATTTTKGVMTRGWRSAMFDRVLRRVRDGHLEQEPLAIKEYWDEFGGLRYKDDVFDGADFRRIFGEGSKTMGPHWVILAHEMDNGLTVTEMTRGLRQTEDGQWVWLSTPEAPAHWAPQVPATTPLSVNNVQLLETNRSDDSRNSSAPPRQPTPPAQQFDKASELSSPFSSPPGSPAHIAETNDEPADSVEPAREPLTVRIPPRTSPKAVENGKVPESMASKLSSIFPDFRPLNENSSPVNPPTEPSLLPQNPSIATDSASTSPKVCDSIPTEDPLGPSNTSTVLDAPPSPARSSMELEYPGSLGDGNNVPTDEPKDTDMDVDNEPAPSSTVQQSPIMAPLTSPSVESPVVESPVLDDVTPVIPYVTSQTPEPTVNATSGPSFRRDIVEPPIIEPEPPIIEPLNVEPLVPPIQSRHRSAFSAFPGPSSFSPVPNPSQMSSKFGLHQSASISSIHSMPQFNSNSSPWNITSPDPNFESLIEATRQLQEAREKLREEELALVHARNLAMEERKISINERSVMRELEQQAEIRERAALEKVAQASERERIAREKEQDARIREDQARERERQVLEREERLKEQELALVDRLQRAQENERLALQRAEEREERAKEQARLAVERAKEQADLELSRAKDRERLAVQAAKEQERLAAEREERARKQEERAGEREDLARKQESRASNWEEMARKKQERLEERAREEEERARQERMLLNEIRANYEAVQVENQSLKRRLSATSFFDPHSSFPSASRMRMDDTTRGRSPLVRSNSSFLASSATMIGPNDDESSMQMSPPDTTDRNGPIPDTHSPPHVITKRSTSSRAPSADSIEYHPSPEGASPLPIAGPSRPQSQTNWTRRKFQKFADGE
ncbi:hypothetical protein C8J56DRAFT_980058 [Mycena floridula]|nr:hypothetical protein C8J56DRAFT_980058 [Mycena floridula]